MTLNGNAHGGKKSRGFTLLEVMLAFVLLATAMGMVVAMLSRGLTQVQRSQSASEAMLYAQSQLDAIGVLAPIEPGQSQGEFASGRYHYQLQITETRDPAPRLPTPPGTPEPDASTAAKLYRIVTQVSWGAGGPDQSVRLSTLRLRTPAMVAVSPP